MTARRLAAIWVSEEVGAGTLVDAAATGWYFPRGQ